MDAKKRILATLAGFVVLFLLGWLIYGMLLMDFYASNSGSATGVMRAETDMVWWALIVGNLLQAYFLVYIFGKWAHHHIWRRLSGRSHHRLNPGLCL